jgi:hypothetical protein
MIRKFLKNISVDNVLLLSDINKDFFVDKSGKSNYLHVNSFEIEYFKDFINNLNSNYLYTVIPLISATNNPHESYIVLSRSILVTKYSDYSRIHYFIHRKYLDSLEDFNIKDTSNFTIILKYKRVKFDINQIKRRFS